MKVMVFFFNEIYENDITPIITSQDNNYKKDYKKLYSKLKPKNGS